MLIIEAVQQLKSGSAELDCLSFNLSIVDHDATQQQVHRPLGQSHRIFETRAGPQNAEKGFFVMRVLAARLKERTRTRLLRQTIDSIAIVSLTEPLADPKFAERLAEAFGQFGRGVAVVDCPEGERESEWLGAVAARRPKGTRSWNIGSGSGCDFRIS